MRGYQFTWEGCRNQPQRGDDPAEEEAAAKEERLVGAGPTAGAPLTPRRAISPATREEERGPAAHRRTETGEPTAREEPTLGRGSSEADLERRLKRHFVHLPSDVVGGHLFDGLVIRVRYNVDKGALGLAGRIRATWWQDKASEVEKQLMGGLRELHPRTKDRPRGV